MEQISSGHWDFFHPQLLLTTTRIILSLTTANPTNHEIVVAGRLCSALFAVGSVLMCSIFVGRTSGAVAGVIAAILLGSGSLLFGLAHYMKEDTALLFGLSAFFLSLSWFEENKSSYVRCGILGVAVGLAAAGKYIGVVTFFPAIIVLIKGSAHDRRFIGSRIALFVVSALGTFIAVDLPMLFDFGGFIQGMYREIQHVTTAHFSLVSPPWDPLLLKDAAIFCSVPGLLMFIYVALNAVFGRYPISLKWASVFPIIFLVILQFSTVKLDRYVLPVVVFIQLAISHGFAEMLSSRLVQVKTLAGVSMLVCLSTNVWQLIDTYAALNNSSRLALAEWISTNLPADVIVAQEMIVGLSQDDPSAPHISQIMRTVDLASDFGSIDNLRSKGIYYIAISDYYYRALFFNPFLQVAKYAGTEEKISARQKFYSELFVKGALLFETSAHGVPGTYFSPRLELYRIGP